MDTVPRFEPLVHTVPTVVDTSSSQMLFYNGFGYAHPFALNHDTNLTWRCMYSKKTQDQCCCHATVTTDFSGNIYTNEAHVHDPQFDQNELNFVKNQFLSFLKKYSNCDVNAVTGAALLALPLELRSAGEDLLKNTYSTFKNNKKNECSIAMSYKTTSSGASRDSDNSQLFESKSMMSLIYRAEVVQKVNAQYPLEKAQVPQMSETVNRLKFISL